MIGRRARWSSRRSASKVATTSAPAPAISADMAFAAPMPESIQPSRPTTRTGSWSSGLNCRSTSDTSADPVRGLDGQVREPVEHVAEAAHLLLGDVAHGAAGVARVHAGDDAGQLPVAERDVEAEVRQVPVGGRGVALD